MQSWSPWITAGSSKVSCEEGHAIPPPPQALHLHHSLPLHPSAVSGPSTAWHFSPFRMVTTLSFACLTPHPTLCLCPPSVPLHSMAAVSGPPMDRLPSSFPFAFFLPLPHSLPPSSSFLSLTHSPSTSLSVLPLTLALRPFSLSTSPLTLTLHPSSSPYAPPLLPLPLCLASCPLCQSLLLCLSAPFPLHLLSPFLCASLLSSPLRLASPSPSPLHLASRPLPTSLISLSSLLHLPPSVPPISPLPSLPLFHGCLPPSRSLSLLTLILALSISLACPLALPPHSPPFPSLHHHLHAAKGFLGHHLLILVFMVSSRAFPPLASPSLTHSVSLAQSPSPSFHPLHPSCTRSLALYITSFLCPLAVKRSEFAKPGSLLDSFTLLQFVQHPSCHHSIFQLPVIIHIMTW